VCLLCIPLQSAKCSLRVWATERDVCCDNVDVGWHAREVEQVTHCIRCINTTDICIPARLCGRTTWLALTAFEGLPVLNKPDIPHPGDMTLWHQSISVHTCPRTNHTCVSASACLRLTKDYWVLPVVV
jgi:hypothetical protein